MSVTWNPSDASANLSLSNGNLTATYSGTSGTYSCVRATAAVTTGKKYWAVTVNAVGGASATPCIGVGPSSYALNALLGQNATSAGWRRSGNIYISGSVAASAPSYAAGDKIGVVVDAGAGTVAFYKNGTLAATVSLSVGSGLYPMACGFVAGDQFTLDPTSTAFASPPSGASPLDPGSTPVALAASASATATLSGALSVGAPLAGIAQCETTATAVLSNETPLAGSALCESTATAALSVGVALSGNALCESTATASLSVDAPLSGSAVCESTAIATLSVDSPLAGSASCESTTSATLSVGVPLSGSTVCEATASATLYTRRPITDADYAAWLAGNHARCLLLEIKCWHAGAEITRYISNLGWMSGPYDTPANQPYDDILAAEPQIAMSIDSPFAALDIQLLNTDWALDAWLSDGWDGRQITMLLGDPEWTRADFRAVFQGILDGIDTADHRTINLKLRDRTERLNKPVQTNLMPTGDNAPNANSPIPLLYGHCYNVEPVLENASDLVYQIHDGAIQAISGVRSNGWAISATPDLAHGKLTLDDASEGKITADVWGVGTGGSAPATSVAAWSSNLDWTLGRPVTGIDAVRYDGDAVSGYAAVNTSGTVTLPASLFTVVADYIGPAGTANLTGTCDGTARFEFATLDQYGGAYAQSIANVRIGSTSATATTDLVDCAVTLAHPLPLTVEFLMYNRYDSPEDAGAYWLTATYVSGNTYRVALNFSGQYVAQVNVGGVPLTGLVIDVPPGMDPAQTDVDLDNLTGLTVTADVVRFQATTGAAMDYVSGLTWGMASGTVLAFTAVRLNGASVAYTGDTGARRVTLTNPPDGIVEADFTVQEISAADIVQLLATRSGLLTEDELDLGTFDALKTKTPASLGFYQPNQQRNAVEAIDEVLAAVGAHRYWSRLGKLAVWRLDLPTGTAVREFDPDDVLGNSLTAVRMDIPHQRERVGSRRNWTVQDAASLEGAVSDADRARYAAEYLLPAAVANNDVLTAHPLAPVPDIVPSLFVDASDAQDEADRLASIAGSSRTTFQADFTARAIGLNLGDEIRLTHPRYGFASGANAIVTGIQEWPGRGRVTLTFWK